MLIVPLGFLAIATSFASDFLMVNHRDAAFAGAAHNPTR